MTSDYGNSGKQMIVKPRGTDILWEMLSLWSGATIRIRTTTNVKQGLITFPDHLLATLVCSFGLFVRENTVNKIKGTRFTLRMSAVVLFDGDRRRCCMRTHELAGDSCGAYDSSLGVYIYIYIYVSAF